MINIDKYALQCDLAETYHIIDYKELPVSKVALFSVGLREDSRIKLKMSNSKYPLDTILLSIAVDRLTYLLWAKSKDGIKGRNRPKLISSILLNKNDDRNTMSFETAKDFEDTRKKLLKKGG